MHPWLSSKRAPRPRLIFGLLLVVLALVLAACGEQLANTGGPANTTAPPTAASPAADSPAADRSATLPPAADPTQPSPVEAPTEPAPTSTEASGEPEAPAAASAQPTAEPAASEEAAPPEIACTNPAEPTPPMTEGPYYKTGSPERTSLLEPGIPGTPLLLTGYVLTTDCQPVPGAWIDFWQTDGEGVYDNAGYGLRGHQFTDESGRYTLETVIPGVYPGRTAHIHVKVQAPGGPVLTSQLFLPDAPGNQTDRIFSPQLVMQIEEGPDGVLGTFNFILDAP